MAKKKAPKAKHAGGFQPIEIDLDVYKAIEAGRESFGETPNAILRRLLGVDRAKSRPPNGAPEEMPASGAAPAGEAGLSLPDGAELRADFGGLTISGPVRGGAWEVDGSAVSLPADALIATLTGADEPPPELEGWRDWEVRLPGSGAWRPLRAA